MSETKYTIGLNAAGESEKFPQVWVNKMSGQILVAVPWWDMMENDTLIEGRLSDIDPSSQDERRMKIGAIAQVGWLIENGNGVFFGVGPNVIEHMEILGEL